MNIVVGIYFHPEAYPPTLNAIKVLSKEDVNITVITRRTVKSKYLYAKNVRFRHTSKLLEGYSVDKMGFIRKAFMFFRFVFVLYFNLITKRPKYLLLYDPIPLFAYFLVSKIVRKRRMLVWYHNHDTVDLNRCKKHSVLWYAAKYQNKAFKHIDYFTLPSEERNIYFPLEQFNGATAIIPNFPSLDYNPLLPENRIITGDEVRLLFQGSIGSGHGLEQLLGILGEKVLGYQIKLVLAGKVRPDYLKSLFEKADELDVRDRIEWLKYIPYTDLHKVANQAHIGLAIHEPYNVTYSTGGTASNKIYEYAACGLPVLLYDTQHYRSYLGKYNWTFFTDLSKDSITESLSKIITEYDFLSANAKKDVVSELNYETVFARALTKLNIELINTIHRKVD